jgi:hypothetical protein
LRVAPAPDAGLEQGLSAWSGTVVDLESGVKTLVRDLYTRGAGLLSPMVWTESFARCEHPSAVVRWSDLEAITEDGRVLHPGHVRVNYQARRDGGCDNTTVSVDELGVLQTTASRREVPQGAILPIPVRGR